MIRYEYRCKSCSGTVSVFGRAQPQAQPGACPSCGGPLRRVWGFAFHRFPEHWNHSVGAPVSSHREFRAKLREMSERATERTGIPHNYEPVDPTDMKALGVTAEGIEQKLG